MKRFLSIALTAVMLMAAVPVQVSSEGEVLLTLEPVETAAEIPALAAVPAATPSPTPSPTPAPAQAEPIVILEIVEAPATPAPAAKAAPAEELPVVTVELAPAASQTPATDAPKVQAPAAPEKKAAEPAQAPASQVLTVTATVAAATEKESAEAQETAAPETEEPAAEAADETPAEELESEETVEIAEPETEGQEETETVELTVEEPAAAEEAEAEAVALELNETAEPETEETAEPEAPAPEAEETAEPEAPAPEVEETAEPDTLALEAEEPTEDSETELEALEVMELSDTELTSLEILTVSSPAMLADGAKALAVPALSVSPQLVKRGVNVYITLSPVENATSYLLDIFNISGQSILKGGATNFSADSKPHGIKTSDVQGGQYRLVVTAKGDGYADSTAEAIFRAEIVELTASATSVETGVDYTLTVNAPQADSATLYEDGKAVSARIFNKNTAGSHTYRLEAAFGSGTLTEEVTVTVTATKGKLAQATVTVPDTVEQKDGVSFTVGAVANAERYTVNVYDAANKAILEDTAETAKTYQIEAAKLTAGEYRIVVLAEASGYEASTAEKSFTVTASTEHVAALAADKTEVPLGTDVVLTLSAPEADSAVLYSKVGDAEEQEEKSWTGEIPATYTVTCEEEARVAYRLAARWGEETVNSSPVFVNYVSDVLEAPDLTLSAAAAKAGEQVKLDVKAVEHATTYSIAVCEPSGDVKVEKSAKESADFTVNIYTDSLPAGLYNIVVKAQAEGYTESESSIPFRVVDVVLAADPLIVDVGAEYTVTVTAEDAEAVNLFREGEEIPVDEWEDGEEFTFTDSSDEEAEYVYTAEARYGDKWFTSNTVTVQVKNVVKLTASAATVETGTEYIIHGVAEDAESSVLYEDDTAVSGAGPDWKFTKFAAGEYTYRLEGKFGDTVKKAEITVTVAASKGALAKAALDVAATVEQSENLRITLGAVPNATSYEMIIYDGTGKAVARVPSPRVGTSTLSTAGTLPVGQYRVAVTAKAAGYDQSVTEKDFSIVETVDHTLTITASKTSVTTLEAFTLTLTAPGASAMELVGVNQAGETVYYDTWESGGTQIADPNYAFADIITYTLRGQFGSDWEESEPVAVRVTAAKGNLEQTTLSYYYQVASGADVNINFTAVPNAASYNLRLINAQTQEVAASAALTRVEAWKVTGLPDGHYLLEAEAAAPAYNASLTKGSLHVGAIDQTVAFSVADSTVNTGSDIVLNINAPHADQLRLYVKAGNAEETLLDTFDYTAEYAFTYDRTATLTLRLEGLLNGVWVKASATRSVTVVAPNGTLKAPVVDVASQIKKGDTLIFTVSKADNATAQTVTIGLKSGTAVTKVYDGAAVSRTFKIDTSRLAEGEYVITAFAAAPGYNAASATTSVYVGTPATPTPTATAKTTATPTATAKATATPKPTATKKPSSGGSSSGSSSSKKTATPKPSTTPKVVVATTITPMPLTTPAGLPTPAVAVTTAPAMEDNGIMYREAINVQETYGVDTSSDLDAFFMLLEMGEEMNITAAANGTRYVIQHVDQLLNDNEKKVFSTLKPKDQLFVTAAVIGMNEFVDLLDEGEFSIETWVLIDDIQMRVDNMSAQEKQDRKAKIQQLFGRPAASNGEAVYGIDVTISNGFTTRYERYTFRKDELWDWLLYKIYIGTSLGGNA